MSHPFTTRQTIRFGETDPAGLVYYPNLFHYIHTAMEEFLGFCSGEPYHELVARGIGFPTVKVEAEFLVPLVYGDEVETTVAVTRIGRSALELTYELRRARDGILCARSHQVHVAMDLGTRRSLPIPDEYRERLKAEG